MRKDYCKGFSLLEVLVSLVIVSISLSWSLYVLSEAFTVKRKIENRVQIPNLLEKGFIEILYNQKEKFLSDLELYLEKPPYLLVYRQEVINLLDQDLWKKVKVKTTLPSDLLTNISDLSEKGSFSIKIIRAQLFKIQQGKTILLKESFFPPS